MSSEKFIQVEALNCPKCAAPLVDSPSRCLHCGAGLYYETLDHKTGLERDRWFEEGLVQFIAKAAEAAGVDFEWGGVSAENFTLGFVICAQGEVKYAELSFEKSRGGRGVYVFDLSPDGEGHGGEKYSRWSGWVEIVPIHKKGGGSIYKAEGGGARLRYWEGGVFSDTDLKSGNEESLIGQVVAGWLEGKF